MIDSVIPIILIFIYLLLVFSINYYKISNKKRIIDKKIKLELINPTVMFYYYDNNSNNRLFWLTLLELIDKEYYRLNAINDITYIKWNKKENFKIDVSNFNNFEIILINYLNKIICASEKNTISLEELNKKVTSDWSFQKVLNSFIVELKKESIKGYGNIDKISIFKEPLILTYIYSLQVLYFLNVGFNFFEILVISIPFSIITLLITDLLKNNFIKYSIGKYSKIVIASFLLSIIAFNIWTRFPDVDYILFHVLMGILTFMYPLLIITNIYFIKTTSNYFNKLQKQIIDELDEMKVNLLNNKNINIKISYIYGLKVNNIINKKEYNDFIDIF